MKYDELKKLDELRLSGALTQEEFEREKAKLLSGGADAGDASVADDGLYWGMNEKSYAMCLHLSQFLGSFWALLSPCSARPCRLSCG